MCRLTLSYRVWWRQYPFPAVQLSSGLRARRVVRLGRGAAPSPPIRTDPLVQAVRKARPKAVMTGAPAKGSGADIVQQAALQGHGRKAVADQEAVANAAASAATETGN